MKLLIRASERLRQEVQWLEYIESITQDFSEGSIQDVGPDALSEIRKAVKNIVDSHIQWGLRALDDKLQDMEDIRDLVFKRKRAVLNELILADGSITVSKEGIIIRGVVKLGEDDFKEQILGQTTFG